MRKTVMALALGTALTAGAATSASAQAQCVTDPTGALVAGTVAGVGSAFALHHAWGFGHTGLSGAGAAVGGFVVGVGVVALVDALTSPCRGFAILTQPAPEPAPRAVRAVRTVRR